MIIAIVIQLFLINKMLKSKIDKTELKESYTAWTISNYKIFREKLISNDPNKCFSRLAWKDERFIFHIIKNNRQDLKYGPPSFNENKKILLKVIHYYPEYYFKLKPKMQKDKDIVIKAIRSNPQIIRKINAKIIKGINPFHFVENSNSTHKSKVNDAIFKGFVCITGKLKTHKTKEEAYEVLDSFGYSIINDVSKDCHYLINESGVESAKTKAAKQRCVDIIFNIGDLL